MKKTILVLLVLCMIISCFPAAAQADDATLGGTGITVYPIDDTQVEMEEEIIDITVKDGMTYVNCQFFFHNTGEKTTLLVGFPTQYPGFYESQEDLNNEMTDDDHYDEFNITQLYWFRTFIHGKRVPVRVKKGLKPEGNNTDELYFPQWYTWKMTIGRGKRLKVVNRYYMRNSFGGENSEWTNYILRSGSTWKGPIGKVTVRMKFEGYDMCDVILNEMRPSYVENDGTIVWEAENIEPKQDISASFTDSSGPYWLDNPFDYDAPEYDAYEIMSERMLRNFRAKHYNGTTWWSHKLINRFGDDQSDGFYYVVGVSYYKCKRYDKALAMLKKAVQQGGGYFVSCTYYKALIYRKTKNMIGYRECLGTLAAYDYSPGYKDWGVYWLQLWAQSRLDDMGEAC